MPGLVPAVADEREVLLAYLAQQRDALRYAAHGLSDGQASARPTASELCLAGLIKHVALVEGAWTTFLTTGDTSVFDAEDDYVNGFSLVGSETLADVLAQAAEQARLTEEVVTGLSDLGAPLPATTDVVPWIPPARCGRPAGCCCTSSRRRRGTPAMPTSSARPSTVRPVGH